MEELPQVRVWDGVDGVVGCHRPRVWLWLLHLRRQGCRRHTLGLCPVVHNTQKQQWGACALDLPKAKLSGSSGTTSGHAGNARCDQQQKKAKVTTPAGFFVWCWLSSVGNTMWLGSVWGSSGTTTKQTSSDKQNKPQGQLGLQRWDSDWTPFGRQCLFVQTRTARAVGVVFGALMLRAGDKGAVRNRRHVAAKLKFYFLTTTLSCIYQLKFATCRPQAHNHSLSRAIRDSI